MNLPFTATNRMTLAVKMRWPRKGIPTVMGWVLLAFVLKPQTVKERLWRINYHLDFHKISINLQSSILFHRPYA